MDAYGVVVTVVVMLAIAAAILMFERRRATRIEKDLAEMAEERRRETDD